TDNPTAAPTTGPSATFCGRSPSAPAAAPATVATGSPRTPVTRCAAQPTGAATAPLARIRPHRAGTPSGAGRARAAASTAASNAAPAAAPPSTAPRPRRPAPFRPAPSAAPASAPSTPADTACPSRPGSPCSSVTKRTYRLRRNKPAHPLVGRIVTDNADISPLRLLGDADQTAVWSASPSRRNGLISALSVTILPTR